MTQISSIVLICTVAAFTAGITTGMIEGLRTMQVKPMPINHAVYRDMTDHKWYWTVQSFSKPVGPFESREAAREDFRLRHENEGG